MIETIVVTTDKQGLRDIRGLREQYARGIGEELGKQDAPRPTIRLAEILTVPEEADNYSEFAARIAKRADDAIDHVRDVANARTCGGRPLLMRASGDLVMISTSLHLDVQLTEDLDAAIDFATSPATAKANVLTRNSSGNLVKLTYSGSDVQVTVTNRYENWDTVPAFAFGGVIMKNDEWRPDDFDCDAAAGGLI